MNTAPGLRLDIQCLRAVAVLAVILFQVLADWLPGGFVGVDVFFAITGFIVSRVILQRGIVFRGSVSTADGFVAFFQHMWSCAGDLKLSAANAQLMEVGKMYQGAKLVDLNSSSLFETTPFCKGDVIYMDKYQLNELGAVRYAEQVRTQLAELLTTGVTRS